MSEQDIFNVSPLAEFGCTRLSRRHFMESAALAGVAASLAEPAWAQAATNAQLPDGSEFTFWEQPLAFSKTYYVDGNASNADE